MAVGVAVALPLQPMLQTEQHGCRLHNPTSGLQDVTCQRLVMEHVYNVLHHSYVI